MIMAGGYSGEFFSDVWQLSWLDGQTAPAVYQLSSYQLRRHGRLAMLRRCGGCTTRCSCTGQRWQHQPGRPVAVHGLWEDVVRHHVLGHRHASQLRQFSRCRPSLLHYRWEYGCRVSE